VVPPVRPLALDQAPKTTSSHLLAPGANSTTPRRKGYRKKQGHRQNFTEIRIDEVALA